MILAKTASESTVFCTKPFQWLTIKMGKFQRDTRKKKYIPTLRFIKPVSSRWLTLEFAANRPLSSGIVLMNVSYDVFYLEEKEKTNTEYS